MERRLGRGLGSLLGAVSDSSEPASGAGIAVDQIRPNPFQPRRDFDSEALEELRASIQVHGVLQPICVRRAGAVYELIAGERRWRASQLAGLPTIPAVIRDGVSDAQMLQLALVENIQRTDLNPLEKAQGYRELIERLGLTHEQAAVVVGVRRATISNHLRLLDLPESVQKALRAQLVSMGHARALLALGEAKAMEAMLQRIVHDGLSVRQVEALSRSWTPSKPATNASQVGAPPEPSWVGACETRLRESLGTKVRIMNRPGYRGQILIEYYARDELDRLLEKLAPTPQI